MSQVASCRNVLAAFLPAGHSAPQRLQTGLRLLGLRLLSDGGSLLPCSLLCQHRDERAREASLPSALASWDPSPAPQPLILLRAWAAAGCSDRGSSQAGPCQRPSLQVGPAGQDHTCGTESQPAGSSLLPAAFSWHSQGLRNYPGKGVSTAQHSRLLPLHSPSSWRTGRTGECSQVQIQ